MSFSWQVGFPFGFKFQGHKEDRRNMTHQEGLSN